MVGLHIVSAFEGSKLHWMVRTIIDHNLEYFGECRKISEDLSSFLCTICERI